VGARGLDRSEENRRAANLGVGLIAACSALILGTVWFLPTTSGGRAVSLSLIVAAMVISVALNRLPWTRLPTEALLVFPALGILGMTLGALLSTGVSPAYTGFFTVVIFYVASTQRERLVLVTIAVCLPCWVVCQGGLSATIAVKLPITAGVWLLIGHSLARRRATNQVRMRDLLHAASTDPLTGFASRGELAHVLERTEAGDAVILIDLDGFKAINDSRGHEAGDDVLITFGRSVHRVLRASDVAVRYGGDEVLLLAPGAGAEGANALLERLRAEWGRRDRPTFSAGVAVRGDEDPMESLRRADKALYQAKARGRNRWSHAAVADGTPFKVVR